MNSLSMGGESSLISNPTLLQAPSALQVRMNRIKGSFDDDGFFHHNTLAPFLMQNANLVQIAMTFESDLSNENSYIFPDLQVATPRHHSELLSREDFQGLLILKVDLHINMKIFDYPRLETQLDEVIVLLEEGMAE